MKIFRNFYIGHSIEKTEGLFSWLPITLIENFGDVIFECAGRMLAELYFDFNLNWHMPILGQFCHFEPNDAS